MAALSKRPPVHEPTVPDWLRWRSSVSADSLALKAGPVEWSYGKLQENVGRLASGLRSRGVVRGDRAAILMSPSAQQVAVVLALARVSAIAVPLNHRLSPRELRSQLRDSSPSIVIHDEEFGAEAAEAGGIQARRWVDASDLGDREPMAGDLLDLSAPQAIVYTSGSSGAPKGVVLTVSNLMWNAVSVGLRVGASPVDRWLLCLPLFHVGGYSIIFRSLLYGSAIVLHPKFDAKRVSLSMDNDAITLASFVPTMLTEFLSARGGKPLNPRVRAIFVGGGPPAPGLVAAARERRLPILMTYGMTETCSQVALSSNWSSSEGPAYLPILPNQIAVTRRGTHGRLEPAEADEVGEVAVRGPTIFSGYWRKPAASRERFKDGWFLTGDLGLLQAGAGKPRGVVILGRKDETIVSGGEKVYPAEVEAALRSHPSVKEAVVIGIDDPKWGQRVVAVIETRAAASRPPSAAKLSEFLGERLGRYKIPKQYHFWPSLPRTPTGKPRRAEVRAALERGEAG